MATLLLTAVGTAVGGPIGGAIGAFVGQQIDGAAFGPDSYEGPRISDLSVTTSTYGQAIPRIFGSMRMPGTIIWATDIWADGNLLRGAAGDLKTAGTLRI